jgi:hypothetical protein
MPTETNATSNWSHGLLSTLIPSKEPRYESTSIATKYETSQHEYLTCCARLTRSVGTQFSYTIFKTVVKKGHRGWYGWT